MYGRYLASASNAHAARWHEGSGIHSGMAYAFRSAAADMAWRITLGRKVDRLRTRSAASE